MNILEIDIHKYLTTTYFNPNPNRISPDELPVSERNIPLTYNCENCELEISFKNSDFKKHISSEITNLKTKDQQEFLHYEKTINVKNLSFLDFYCPECKQAAKILFTGGPLGLWGPYPIA